MAIKELGESLLADVRQRNDSLAKAARKRQDKAALIAGGIKLASYIGNEALERQTSDFLKNEQIWKASAHQRKATENMSNWTKITQEINGSGKSAEQWYIDKHKGDFESYLKSVLPDEKIGPAGPYGEFVNDEMNKMAKKFAEAYDQVQEVAGSVGTDKEFASMVALNTNKAIPKDVGEWTANSILNFFSGKSQDDIKSSALESIKNGSLSKNAEAFNTLMTEFYKTNDLVRAYDFKNVVFPETDTSKHDSPERIVSEEMEIKTFGDVPIMYTKVTTENINTGKKTVKLKNIESDAPIDLSKLNSPEQLEAAAVKAKMGVVNFAKDARDALTPEGFVEFATRVSDAGFNIANPATVDEYESIAKIYQDEFLNDGRKVKNEFIQEQSLLFLETATKGLDVTALIANITNNPEKKDEYIKKFTASISLMFEASASMRANLQAEK